MVQLLGLDSDRPAALDAVGTLLVPAEPVPETYRRHARRFGATLLSREIDLRFQKAYSRIWSPKLSTRTSEEIEKARWRRLVHEVFQGSVRSKDLLFHALWQHYARGEAWRLAEGVEALIQHLNRKQIAWGIASNFDQRLHSVVRSFPALRGARFIFTSAELGVSKPSRVFFKRISEVLSHDSPLMIGDSLSHDIDGALQAGWQAAWITTKLRRPVEHPRLVFQWSLEALLKAVT